MLEKNLESLRHVNSGYDMISSTAAGEALVNVQERMMNDKQSKLLVNLNQASKKNMTLKKSL